MASKHEDKLAPKFRRRLSLGRRCRLLALTAVVLATQATLATGSALAADSVYWGTEGENTISFAHLDGSGGGDLATTGATANNTIGVAIDATAGKIYWANNSATKISFANLDGSGGGDLNTGTATVNEPFGLAIDPGAGKIYWANSGNNTISYANLNGTGGGNLSTAGATVSSPAGIAIDPATNRIYWANYSFSGGTISYANLDGSGGGGLLSTTGATMEGPEGVAIEPVMGRIYWANYHGAVISYANLNGTGGGNLSTGVATVSSPSGVAIDPVAEKIYWANSTNPNGGISYANLNGTGGGNLPTTGAMVIDPAFPALLESPSGTGAPTITPTTTAGLRAGSMQTCTQGSWAPDVLSEFFYRAPQTYSFSWQLSGTEITGANAETFTPTQPGLYTCRVTATNHAGSSTQTSAAVQISSAPPIVSGAAETHRVWRRGRKLAQISASKGKKKPPVGTTFSFSLNERASVKFSFFRGAHVRKCGRKLGAAKARGCLPLRAAGALSFTGHSGTNRVVFQGRISRSKALKPGRYTLIITATNAAGQQSNRQSLRFTIALP